MNNKLLEKYIAGDATQEEKEQVQLWLDDKKNMKEFMALRMMHDFTLAHMEEPDKQQRSPKRSLLPVVYSVLKVAAVVIVTFGLSYFVFQNTGMFRTEEETVMQSLYVPPGQRAELTLSDGTVVWLNAQTKLTFPSKFTENAREVFLDGEAYFDVTHNEEQKFIVNTSMYKVNVLGTEFDVIAYNKNNYFETSLINGKVEIISNNGAESLILNPGERVYSKDNKLIRTSITHYNHFLWKKGIISFEQEQIEDMFTKLNLYYDIDIINQNESIKNIRYTGKFHTKDGIDHVINVLKIALGFKSERDKEKNQIVIE